MTKIHPLLLTNLKTTFNLGWIQFCVNSKSFLLLILKWYLLWGFLQVFSEGNQLLVFLLWIGSLFLINIFTPFILIKSLPFKAIKSLPVSNYQIYFALYFMCALFFNLYFFATLPVLLLSDPFHLGLNHLLSLFLILNIGLVIFFSLRINLSENLTGLIIIILISISFIKIIVDLFGLNSIYKLKVLKLIKIITVLDFEKLLFLLVITLLIFIGSGAKLFHKITNYRKIK